jgi:mitochondrial pyruvate carrier 2
MASRLRALWDHPAGMKTVFFWAPTMKWGLVAASASEMQKPTDKLSIPQCTALALTGCVWTRWSFVITPVNYNLALANLFVAGTNVYQLSRIFWSPTTTAPDGTVVSASTVDAAAKADATA